MVVVLAVLVVVFAGGCLRCWRIVKVPVVVVFAVLIVVFAVLVVVFAVLARQREVGLH